ncbi:hypothetical protein HYH03_013224 [Edaphochlamys debaryana]|uniref:Uncharacterized protein n=1 Tax=Edaphochlamys debaryana TaxID=47281 RepID=A0A836BT64_9CHLO|nr:hypothetical protein HYH03_013224 [Edaphochlamys debaryana]|eukprot:KAG2488231.1 hypothetical protein HYH03_013224 [Edaphochlamys debaryana]
MGACAWSAPACARWGGAGGGRRAAGGGRRAAGGGRRAAGGGRRAAGGGRRAAGGGRRAAGGGRRAAGGGRRAAAAVAEGEARGEGHTPWGPRSGREGGVLVLRSQPAAGLWDAGTARTDDLFGVDDTKCMLTYVEGLGWGNVDEATLCGKQAGTGTSEIHVLVNGTADAYVGDVIAFLEEATGWLTVTLRLNCPWLAAVGGGLPGGGIRVAVSGPGGTSWPEQWPRTVPGTDPRATAAASPSSGP